MKKKVLCVFGWIVFVMLPAAAQVRVYPVRDSKEGPVILTTDRSAVVIDKAFQHKSTLGYPTDEKTAFVPETRAPLLIMWLRIQNTGQKPLQVDTSKFAAKDDQGMTYRALSPEEAANRIVEDPGASLSTKALRGISLGKVGSKPAEETLRADIQRYSVMSGPMPAGTVRDGLIYFEAPERKKFTVGITLGELWSKPVWFSTEKR